MSRLTRFLLAAIVCVCAFSMLVHAQGGEGDQAATDAGAVATATTTPAETVAAPTTEAPTLTQAPTDAAGGAAVAANGQEFSMVGSCEVCIYVVENKMQHQPYLCKGLKDPSYQELCVQVMESLMWWVSNEVYWVNYGCEMNNNGVVQWVRPCPAHAVCSWLQHLYARKPYCSPDANFPKPA